MNPNISKHVDSANLTADERGALNLTEICSYASGKMTVADLKAAAQARIQAKAAKPGAKSKTLTERATEARPNARKLSLD